MSYIYLSTCGNFYLGLDNLNHKNNIDNKKNMDYIIGN